MNILLLGATGRTGKHILNQGLKKGYKINALVRYPQKVKTKSDSLTLFEGNAINKEDLEQAIRGCEVIISALNISRTSDFPWAKLRTPEKYLSEVMQNILDVADPEAQKRIIICSAWGVAETKSDIPGWFRWFIDNSNIGVAYADHERQEKLLVNSELNYSIIRPVGLTNFGLSEVRETFNNEPKPGILVSRKSVANYMLEAISNDTLFHKKVVISA